MTVGIIQAASQREKNGLLYECTVNATRAMGAEVVNFGVFPGEDADITYVEAALCAGLLLASGAVDFIVTGCSSGQGMMLACNSLPGVLCGYAPTPQDAFLFGRINAGNAVSLPLGLNFGWSGEINLQCTLDKLFDGPFGAGYPPADAPRKAADTARLKGINAATKRPMAEAFPLYDKAVAGRALKRRAVTDYILSHGTDESVKALIRAAL
ncbi:MAG: RpiB/LacA/LacB family sugar-phosphate isomerase [Clostridia bacterium]|nr:RpiB/LacA/LacB family sugar-phosphate isomerase [Clostridia bacterium]